MLLCPCSQINVASTRHFIAHFGETVLDGYNSSFNSTRGQFYHWNRVELKPRIIWSVCVLHDRNCVWMCLNLWLQVWPKVMVLSCQVATFTPRISVSGAAQESTIMVTTSNCQKSLASGSMKVTPQRYLAHYQWILNFSHFKHKFLISVTLPEKQK